MARHALHAGRLTRATQGSLEAIIPDVPLGAIVSIARPGGAPLFAEVIGVHGAEAQLAPWSDPAGCYVGATAEVVSDRAPRIDLARAGGRVLNAHGVDMHSLEALQQEGEAPRPSPFTARVASQERLHTGIRAVDMLLPVVKGQRVGIFAGAGVGKTTLLTQLANQVRCDRAIIALIGERSREVVALTEELQALESWPRITLIVATSDDPAALRVRAAWAAMELAQDARRQGEDVVLLVDSFTRWVRARRDLALLAGERPARGGIPPSAFAAMAPLVEGAGAESQGSITAFFTILLEADAMEDPIGDEARGLVEAHWILNRALAQQHIFPAIGIADSLSRLAGDALNDAQLQVYRRLRHGYAALDELREAQRFGFFAEGADRTLDAAHAHRAQLEAFLRQRNDAATSWADTQQAALELYHQLEALDAAVS